MRKLLLEYEVFLSRIEEIQKFLAKIDKNNSIEKIEKVLMKTEKEITEYMQFLKSLSSSQLVYNAIIISIYGCFENYIDNLLSVYLEKLSENITDYSQLPVKLQEKYRLKMGEFISNPQRFKNLDLDFNKEIKKFYELLESNLDGTINKHLALSHAGNLRLDELLSLMSELGINEPKNQILDHNIFKTFYLERGMDEIEFKTKRTRNTNDFFLPLEQLIMQRNYVAHSWNVENRIDLREIGEVIIPFILMLCNCIFRICVTQVFSFDKNVKCMEQENPIAVYNKKIVCLNSQKQNIAVGDYIIYTSNDRIKIARIENIQVDGKDIKSINEDTEKEIGLQIDNTIKSSDKLKVIINAM